VKLKPSYYDAQQGWYCHSSYSKRCQQDRYQMCDPSQGLGSQPDRQSKRLGPLPFDLATKGKLGFELPNVGQKILFQRFCRPPPFPFNI
jgi:hypothetical protein